MNIINIFFAIERRYTKNSKKKFARVANSHMAGNFLSPKLILPYLLLLVQTFFNIFFYFFHYFLLNCLHFQLWNKKNNPTTNRDWIAMV